MRDFKKYEIWQLSHQFVINIYRVSRNFSKEERFNLTSQLRRASTSIQRTLVKVAVEIPTKNLAIF